MIKTAVIGAFGYSGKELISILIHHPEVEIVSIADKDHIGKPYSSIYPEMLGKVGIVCESYDLEKVARESDVVFLALPHRVSILFAGDLVKKGLKVIDFSGDFRLKDPEEYEKWYGSEHTAVSLLKEAAYGLPEINHEQIKAAQLIANPGCFPTASILATYPVYKEAIVQSCAIIDAKTGVSGAGRGLSLITHFPECNENIVTYKVGRHQHTPEIIQELSKGAKNPVQVLFTPTLVPVNRGILATIYLELKDSHSTLEIIDLYKDFYKDCPFVKILPEGMFPQTKFSDNTNYCFIGLQVDKEKGILTIISTIDNLVKGAAGQAVQNMNIICGLDETIGLL